MSERRGNQDVFASSKRSSEHGFTSSRRSAEHGFTSSRRSAEHGFTLVELMVALLIFGMLAAAGVGLFAYSARSQEAVARRLSATADQTRLVALLSADLAQAIKRPYRAPDGTIAPAFAGTNGVGSAPLLTFVRAGVSNPGEAPRGSLQRIEWRLAGQALERVSYPYPDGASDGTVAVMAQGIEGVTPRYRGTSDWVERWQPERPDLLPRAVELTLKPSGQPPFVMAFLVGTPTP